MKFFENIKYLLKYTKNSRKYIISYIIFSITLSLIGVLIPFVVAMQLVKFTNGLWNELIIFTLMVALLNILKEANGFLIAISSEKLSQMVVREIQVEMAREILKMELSSIDREGNGVFIQRLTDDVNSVSNIFTYGISDLSRMIAQIGIFIFVYFINIYLGIYFSAFILIFFLFGRYRFIYLKKKEERYKDKKEEMTGFTTELVRGIRDIKMLNAEESFMKKVVSNVLELNGKKYVLNKVDNIFWLLWSVIFSFYEVFLILLLIFLICQNQLSLAMGIVVFNYKNTISNLIFSVNYWMDALREFQVSATRIIEILSGSKFKKEHFGQRHLEKVHGDFSFQNVEFSYQNGGRKVLDGLTFSVRANETVAFVGKSGVGKTTVFNLLCKLYDANGGIITIDGVNIQDLDKDSIRGNITIISQNPYIFNMSIRDNLKLVKEDLTEEEMIEACKMASLSDYIESLEKKYDTIVGEGGITLSGGERQRLAIARAFIQKTEIILFDEATSSLDNETQEKIQKAIDHLKKDYTILIIAHRLSTVLNADKIFYLEDGQVKAIGTHEQLLRDCLEYKRLYESEIKKS